MTNLSDKARSFSVLHIDSDRQWLNTIRRELMGAGIREVMVTTDPKEALVQIRDASPNLLITHSDLKFVRFLRHHDASPNRKIPIIMVTSNVGPSDLVSMRDAGVNEIAVKPCSISQLFQRIEAIASRPREFVESEKFTGPSRRRRKKENLAGPERRAG
ncbi:MAG: response regulator [Rhodospirillales bacterium]|nr:response regulator [Alphaproteobacteria bacterium]MBL6942693.1 response regulator [Rhodospirillales bacterium]MBL6948724.1 response regulator [Rhodospirillales bacterium]